MYVNAYKQCPTIKLLLTNFFYLNIIHYNKILCYVYIGWEEDVHKTLSIAYKHIQKL